MRPRRQARAQAAAILLGIALSLSAGCQTEPAPAPAPASSRPKLAKPSVPSTSSTPNNPSAPAAAASARPDPAAAEQCAANLHDLAGALLQYYVMHQRFPESLDQLAPFAEPGHPLPLTCPATGHPYVYHPAGLPSIRDKRFLILHDREPAHNRLRTAIVASPPTANQPPTLWVVDLDEATFLTFTTAMPQ